MNLNYIYMYNALVHSNITVTCFVAVQHVPEDWFENIRVIFDRIFSPLSGPKYFHLS